MGTTNETTGLLSIVDRTPLHTLVKIWALAVLGAGLGGAVGAILEWGWPLSSLGCLEIRGCMIGVGLTYGVLVAVKVVRQRLHAGVGND